MSVRFVEGGSCNRESANIHLHGVQIGNVSHGGWRTHGCTVNYGDKSIKEVRTAKMKVLIRILHMSTMTGMREKDSEMRGMTEKHFKKRFL
jgi:hypothetical protein